MKHKEIIAYVFAKAKFGQILAAQSEKGFCAILIDDSRKTLEEDLKARFPDATFVEGDGKLQKRAAAIAAYIGNPSATIDIELDARGSAFQKKVWDILRKIPAGKTMSYTEVAKKLGMPDAARAVAGACAANPLAVVVPCHRVVRSDGGLSGYRWGIERKKLLLEMERVK